MAAFRVKRNKGYAVMSNHHLRDKELTLKAKGLLSQMLSLPEDWDYTLAGLSQNNRESIDAMRTAVWEQVQIYKVPIPILSPNLSLSDREAVTLPERKRKEANLNPGTGKISEAFCVMQILEHRRMLFMNTCIRNTFIKNFS